MRTPTIYGADGRPLRRRELLREQARPSLAGVRQPWILDAVASGLTPDRVAAVFTAANVGETRDYYTLALEMEERFPTYIADLGVRTRAVLAVEPTVEAASDDAGDVELADGVRGLLARPWFRRLCRSCLHGLGHGVSAVEIMWDRSGPLWTPHECVWRDPRHFRWGREDPCELRLLDESDPADGLPLEPGKWAVHVPQLRPGVPARGGLARVVIALYSLAVLALKDWMVFLDLFGIPVRIGKYGPGASEDDKRVLREAVAGIGSDAAGTIPASMEIELIEAARGSGTDAHEGAIRWLCDQVTRVVLGQTATTEGTPGRLGSDDAQQEVRLDILKSDCADLAETLNRDLVKPWTDLNFGPREEYPRIALRPNDPEDVEALTKGLERLVPLGLRVEASVVRDRLGLPDPAEGAEVLEAQAPDRPGSASETGTATARARARARARTRAEDREILLEEIRARALDGWERVMDPMLDPVRELAARAETREEFLAGLPAALGAMDDGPLREALVSAAFAARGLGDAGDEP